MSSLERARRESNGRPLRPWLIRIAHNLASNYHRDRARKPQSPLDYSDPIAAPHGTERIVEVKEFKHVIDSLEHLPDDRREAIMRFALHGHPDRARPRPHRRRHQGSDPPGDQAARAGDGRR